MKKPTRVVIVNRSTILIDEVRPLTHPLPGLELIFVNLAFELARRHIEVEYLGRCGEACHGWLTFRPFQWKHLRDRADTTYIHLRDYWIPPTMRIGTWQSRHVLFSGDAMHEVAFFLRTSQASAARRLAGYVGQFDKLVIGSQWHAEHWRKWGVRARPGTTEVIYNLTSHLTERLSQGGLHAMLSTGHPRKALVSLTNVVHRLRDVNPSFRCTYLGTPSLYQDQDCMVTVPTLEDGKLRALQRFSEYAQSHAHIVDFRPSVSPLALNAALESHGLYLHPDYSIETGSTTTIEAIRKGLIPVVSDRGVLPELVGDAGVIVRGDPLSPDFTNHCSEAIRGLTHRDVSVLKRRLEHRARTFRPSTITEQWIKVLLGCDATAG